jgi:hypothetical protein
MARVSRPPGFDMTYRPTKATFLVPLGTRLPSLLYFTFAVSAGTAVLLAPYMNPSSWLYETVVVGDRYRVVGVSTVTLFMFISALASVIRQNMAGVILHPDGIELREVLPLGVPRFKRFTWSQIDRVFIPEPKATPAPPKAGEPRRTKIQLHLWNGTQAFLPTVAKHVDLSVMLERVALARAIPIEGGTGLIDDLGNPFGDGEDD